MTLAPFRPHSFKILMARRWLAIVLIARRDIGFPLCQSFKDPMVGVCREKGITVVLEVEPL
jgi:hypothetical protein